VAALKALGLLMWQRRIVRTGPCVDQISNSYMLLTPDGDPRAADKESVKP
jgi:hypothetical protein